MPESLFRGIFDTETTALISPGAFLLCIGCALLIGLIIAAGYAFRSQYTRSFAVTLAILPAVVCVIIMMVNGNVGTGVAVAGAFSLVRFRSAPGTAREIVGLFLSMGAGLIAGMGYLAFALLFALVMSAVLVLYNCIELGPNKRSGGYKTLHITIPEDLDYTGVFDDIFARYTSSCQLQQVKTSNMGSLFKLSYSLLLRDAAEEKEFIDSLRCRNGNLEISVSQPEMGLTGL